MSDELQRPTGNNRDEWKAYWGAQGMPWRTEPEIDDERQRYLAERRTIPPDIQKGVCPFAGVTLERADVEWLLATHESDGVRGPVDWSDERQRGREGLDLRGAELRRVDLRSLPLARLRGGLLPHQHTRTAQWQDDAAAVHLEESNLTDTHLEGAILEEARLERAHGAGTRLEHAYLRFAHCEGFVLEDAHLEGATLQNACLQGAVLDDAHLEGASFLIAQFDANSILAQRWLSSPQYGKTVFLNAVWNGASLNAVDWAQLGTLAEEDFARHHDHRPVAWLPPDVDSFPRAVMFEYATRANRQLASALRTQGNSDWADHYAYHAQALQRQVFWRRRQYLRYMSSLLLDRVSGYGYRPLRSFISYALVILAFAAAYFGLSASSHPLSWNEAIVISMTAFHGRGFFQTAFQPGDLQAAVAAIEAFIGLLIEIVLIATFTQRFCAR